MQQNEKIEVGRINRLLIDRKTEPGLYLTTGEGEDVLLPNQYITDAMNIGDLIDVFIYTDSEDRPVATTLSPIAMRGEFGFFKVVDTTGFGAFVDWGLPKDLFVPRSLQKRPFKAGEKRILYVTLDEQTQRLVGCEKIGSHLTTRTEGLANNTKVTLLVLAKTPLGYKVIVDNLYEGMIYHNEIYEPLKAGDKRVGYVKQIRPDGKLNLSLQPLDDSKDKIADAKVLELLKTNGGRLPYNYKSDAELIKNVFGLSKKSFKRTLTSLHEASLIEIDESGIYLK